MKTKTVYKQISTGMLSLLLIFSLASVFSCPVKAETSSTVTSGGSGNIYIANYAVVDSSGTELTNVTPGQVINIAITIVDERASSSIVVNKQTSNARVRLNPGAFTIPSIGNIEYAEREKAGGVSLCYTVLFRNVTYVGGSPILNFDLSYIDSNNNTFGLPLVTLTQEIGQCADNSSKPEILLKKATYGGTNVVSGSRFTFSAVAANTSPNIGVENVIATIKLPDSLALVGGTSSVVIGNVAPGGEIVTNFTLQSNGADVSTAVVTIEYSYSALVQGKRPDSPYISTQTVSIPIKQLDRFTIGSMQVPESMALGEEGYISLSYSNKGKGILYNVTAEVSGNMSNPGQQQFLGNMAAGAEGSVDFYVSANEVGTMNGELVLSYEDAAGNVTTVKTPFSVMVQEAPVVPVDPGTNIPEVKPSNGIMGYLIGGGVLVAGAVCAALLYRKKKKAKLQMEADDEDI